MAIATQSLRRFVYLLLEKGEKPNAIALKLKGEIGRGSVYRYAKSWEAAKAARESVS